jgi:cell fate regulator YaaT (PSP1 superfamily)
MYHILLPYSHEMLVGWYAGEMLKAGDRVVARTRFGRDLVLVRGSVARKDTHISKIIQIEKIVPKEDLAKLDADLKKEKEAFSICKSKILEHGLEMKLISVHYLFDEAKIMFFFSADARVDFRALVKDLISIFRSRIELRQIAPRYELCMAGGIGICGRCYCCTAINDHLKPVSIKMAKEQGLSLNTAKISGPCGKLLCCLSYEHGFYSAERKTMPKEGGHIKYDGTVFRVEEINAITGTIRLHGEDDRVLILPKERFVKKQREEESQSSDTRRMSKWCITDS